MLKKKSRLVRGEGRERKPDLLSVDASPPLDEMWSEMSDVSGGGALIWPTRGVNLNRGGELRLWTSSAGVILLWRASCVAWMKEKVVRDLRVLRNSGRISSNRGPEFCPLNCDRFMVLQQNQYTFTRLAAGTTSGWNNIGGAVVWTAAEEAAVKYTWIAPAAIPPPPTKPPRSLPAPAAIAPPPKTKVGKAIPPRGGARLPVRAAAAAVRRRKSGDSSDAQVPLLKTVSTATILPSEPTVHRQAIAAYGPKAVAASAASLTVGIASKPLPASADGLRDDFMALVRQKERLDKALQDAKSALRVAEAERDAAVVLARRSAEEKAMLQAQISDVVSEAKVSAVMSASGASIVQKMSCDALKNIMELETARRYAIRNAWIGDCRTLHWLARRGFNYPGPAHLPPYEFQFWSDHI